MGGMCAVFDPTSASSGSSASYDQLYGAASYTSAYPAHVYAAYTPISQHPISTSVDSVQPLYYAMHQQQQHVCKVEEPVQSTNGWAICVY